MGRALLVAEPGSASPRAALEAQGWEVEVCGPDRAEQALTDEVELVACPLAYGGGASGPALLTRLLADHPEVGGFLYGAQVDARIERALLDAPDTPVIRTPATPDLVRLAVESARALPR